MPIRLNDLIMIKRRHASDTAKESYPNVENLMSAFEAIFALLSPKIEEALRDTKEKYPNWQAGVLGKAKFQDMVSRMHQRIERFLTPGALPAKEVVPEEDEIIVTPPKNYVESSTPLNQIPYGPPGTGKTYHSINKALQIVAPEFYEQHKNERKKLTEKFAEYLIKDWSNS